MDFIDTDSAVFIINEDCSVTRYRQGTQEEIFDLLYDFAMSNYFETIDGKYVKMQKSVEEIYMRWYSFLYRIIVHNGSTRYFISISETKFESMLQRLNLLDDSLKSKLNYLKKEREGIWQAEKFSSFMQSLSNLHNITCEELYNFQNVGQSGIIICKKGESDLKTAQTLPLLLNDSSLSLNCELMGIKQIYIIDTTRIVAKKITFNI